MRARCPGSTSNLGPGFDVLGLALSLYVEVEVRPAKRLEISSSGEGEEIPSDENHLAARVARDVVGHDHLFISVSSEIPLAAGLGSSAALAAATAAAAGSTDPLAVAASFDGHAENAAASVLGGLVAATLVKGRPLARKLPLDRGLSYVVVIPDRRLETKEARSVLPKEVPFDDAVYNLGRLGLLLAGLADRAELDPEAGSDRLHEDRRGALFPEASALLAALRSAGAVVSCWSGAGPSLLGICRSRRDAGAVRDAGEEALARSGLRGRSVVLDVDLVGLERFGD